MKLWEKGYDTDQRMQEFTVGNDPELDVMLAPYDVTASAAHASMLGKIGLLSETETSMLLGGLERLGTVVKTPGFTIPEGFEDIHSWIEHELTRDLGELGKKLHTARSRNDQVLTAIQLYLKDAIKQIIDLTAELFNTLMDLAGKHQDQLLPGFTHLQIAMPSSFGLWFSAFAESLTDDVLLFQAAYRIADQNPLGSAAGYGSSFPIDREYTTALLDFSQTRVNVVAAQMGRGKVEKSMAYAMSSLGGTLGKLAMDICLYCSQPFGFIKFPDHLTTGSSIMPHKKNPDVFELIRGKSNRIQALPNELTLLLSNLPSGYHREFQLTKAILFPAIQDLCNCLELANRSISEIQVGNNLLNSSLYDHLFTVDTLNLWVMEGMPFRDAYQKLGADIASGNYTPNRDLKHSHLGSIGNPGFEHIRNKMKQVLDAF